MDDEECVMIHALPRSQPDIPPILHLPKLKGHDLFEITVDELQHLYAIEAFTSEDYVQSCLDRIQATNPYLEAVIETNPDAIRIAQELDEERKQGNIRGPLHGIPVLVKDVGDMNSFSLTPSLPRSIPYYFSLLSRLLDVRIALDTKW